MSGVATSKFYKSFSGTDTIAFLMFPGINPITIGSLTTISYSMYRNKVPVINIGRTNINGITRGSRIYAGTMVFTLINKHWLRELQDQATYLSDYPTLKTDELPLFDIMIVSANEYGSSCSMFIYGVDLTDEAQTISVEDLFTENVFKFVAREVSVFDANIITESDTPKKYYTVTDTPIQNFYIEEQPLSFERPEEEIKALTRNLYLVTNGNPIMGTDVAGIQQLLSIPVTYKFDRTTDLAVRDFQARNGLPVDGIVDNNVYTKLIQKEKGVEYVQIVNKSGAFVYREPDTNSGITETLPYLAAVEIFKTQTTQDNHTFYQTKNGYVSSFDVYNYKENDLTEYKTIKLGDEGAQVTILQNILSELYENFAAEAGVFDETTQEYLEHFQEANDLEVTGVADYFTWAVLLDVVKTSELYRYQVQYHTEVEPSKEPGIYTIRQLDQLNNFTINIQNNNPQQVKMSVLSIYENNKTKTDSKTEVVENSRTFSVSDFANMFKDDINYQSPTDVYYFIYPYGSIPYKWHFVMKG